MKGIHIMNILHFICNTIMQKKENIADMSIISSIEQLAATSNELHLIDANETDLAAFNNSHGKWFKYVNEHNRSVDKDVAWGVHCKIYKIVETEKNECNAFERNEKWYKRTCFYTDVDPLTQLQHYLSLN